MNCPRCNLSLESALVGQRKVRPGDVAVCPFCFTFVEFVDAGTRRLDGPRSVELLEAMKSMREFCITIRTRGVARASA